MGELWGFWWRLGANGVSGRPVWGENQSFLSQGLTLLLSGWWMFHIRLSNSHDWTNE
jgi:hypothetical protein